MSARTIRSVIEGQELVTAPKNMPVREAARLMKQHNVGAILVVEGDKLAGVFTERDALNRVVAEGRDPGDLTTMEDPAALQQIKDLLVS